MNRTVWDYETLKQLDGYPTPYLIERSDAHLPGEGGGVYAFEEHLVWYYVAPENVKNYQMYGFDVRLVFVK
jgi:hypothetical protein